MAEDLRLLHLHPRGAREQRRHHGQIRDLATLSYSIAKFGIVAIQLSMVRRETAKRAARIWLVAPAMQARLAISVFFGLFTVGRPPSMARLPRLLIGLSQTAPDGCGKSSAAGDDPDSGVSAQTQPEVPGSRCLRCHRAAPDARC
jgi:hypothetical protein